MLEVLSSGTRRKIRLAEQPMSFKFLVRLLPTHLVDSFDIAMMLTHQGLRSQKVEERRLFRMVSSLLTTIWGSSLPTEMTVQTLSARHQLRLLLMERQVLLLCPGVLSLQRLLME